MDVLALLRDLEARHWPEAEEEDAEATLAQALERLSPRVPAVEWHGAQDSNSDGEIVLYSHADVPDSYHNSLEFWERFRDDALFVLYAHLSSYGRMYRKQWDVFPRRRLELLHMSADEKARLPKNWYLLYGPYTVERAPNDACRGMEEALDDVLEGLQFTLLRDEELKVIYKGASAYQWLFGIR